MKAQSGKDAIKNLGLSFDLDRLYTAQEAGQIAAVHKATILRAIEDGRLKAHRPTVRKVWITGRNLYRWLTGEEPPPASETRLDDVVSRARKGGR